MSREEIIRDYFEQVYSYSAIKEILKKEIDYDISYRHLQRIIKSLDLKRKYIKENIPEIIDAIINELGGSGICLGYKAMWLRLKLKYGLRCYRNTVLELLRILDPDGTEERSKYRLKRRVYKVAGPNFLWHMDGHDKLKPFGFPIHGCIDGYSRKIIWLQVSTTNNKPEVICYFYLTAVKKLKVIPTLIRSDLGTENSVVENVQQVLRYNHTDELAGLNSFVKGKSTANQRIESFWGRQRRHTLNFWILFFKDMVDCGHFEKSNSMQQECLRFCFGPLIQYDLDLLRKEWNRHPIRSQKGTTVKSGKPNYLYYMPEQSGTQNHGFICEEESIQNAFNNFTEKPTYCHHTFLLLVDEILPNVQLPKNVQEATLLYHKILSELKKYN